MRAARLFTVAAAVLALGSCQVLEFIFGSVFPSTVTLAKAQADLSAQIDANSAGAFHLRVMQSGSNGYVIVIGNPGGAGTIAYVYDLDLNPVTTLKNVAGDGVLVDATGFVVVGNFQYGPATFAQQATPLTITLDSNGTDSGEDGFSVGGTTEVYGFDIPSGSTTLSFSGATAAWAGTTLPAPPALTSAPTGLLIDAILDDGNPAGNVTLAVHQSNSNNKGTATCYFMTTAKANYTGGLVPSTLYSAAPHLDNIVNGCIGFAQGSIIAYDGSAGRFLRINPSDGSIQSSFYSGTDMTNTRLGYLASGGYFYGFDTKTRVLTKYAAWW